MKYNITYACGHEGVVNLGGPEKDRERTIHYLEHSGECPTCKAERLQNERAAASEEAEKQDLPDLLGSDKQVVWAAQIRRHFCDYSRQMIDRAAENISCLPEDEQPKARAGVQDLYAARNHILTSYSHSKWWIEHQSERDFYMAIYNTTLAIREATVTKPMRDNIAQKTNEAEAEAVVVPINQTHSGVVKIIVDGNTISVRYPRDDDFRSVVYSLHYKWDKDRRDWRRTLDRFSGYLVDRVAELGNKLLVAGFAVSIIDLEQRRRAVAAEYAPECRRWVKLYTGEEHTGDLCVCWDREDDLFSTIHKIHGSHWYCGAMAVPIASWNEVLDMAEMLGFQISDMAQEAINTYRNHLNPAVSVSPAPEPVQQPDKLSAILNSSPDVLSDLKDEEQD